MVITLFSAKLFCEKVRANEIACNCLHVIQTLENNLRNIKIDKDKGLKKTKTTI